MIHGTGRGCSCVDYHVGDGGCDGEWESRKTSEN